MTQLAMWLLELTGSLTTTLAAIVFRPHASAKSLLCATILIMHFSYLNLIINQLTEPCKPTNASSVPTKKALRLPVYNKCWPVSRQRTRRKEEKCAYIKLNAQLTCPLRAIVSANQGRVKGDFCTSAPSSSSSVMDATGPAMSRNKRLEFRQRQGQGERQLM